MYWVLEDVFCARAVRRNKWEQRTLIECLYSWIVDKYVKVSGLLPSFVIWGIWLSRNIMIFSKV